MCKVKCWNVRFNRFRKFYLRAEDVIEAKTVIQKAKAAKSLELLKKKGKCSRTANLADSIEVKKGAKIM